MLVKVILKNLAMRLKKFLEEVPHLSFSFHYVLSIFKVFQRT